MIDVLILGSGTSTGVPVPGCSCPVCRSRNPRNHRLRASILLQWQQRHILIDMSPDLRYQALRAHIRSLDAVLVTHTHADHVHGIDDVRPFTLGQKQPLPLYASAPALESLQKRFAYVFRPGRVNGYVPRLAPFAFYGPFSLWGQVVEPLPLPHGRGWSWGFRIGNFAYLTDCSGIPRRVRRQLQGLQWLVLDGLRFRPHPGHLSISEALDLTAELAPQQTLLTHLSHDVDYERHRQQLPPAVDLAYDGCRFQVAPRV